MFYLTNCIQALQNYLKNTVMTIWLTGTHKIFILKNTEHLYYLSRIKQLSYLAFFLCCCNCWKRALASARFNHTALSHLPWGHLICLKGYIIIQQPFMKQILYSLSSFLFIVLSYYSEVGWLVCVWQKRNQGIGGNAHVYV